MSWRIEETNSRIIVYVDEGPAEIGFAILCQKAQSMGKKLVLDFGDVVFLSSGVIDQLILLNKQSKSSKVQLWLANGAASLFG